MRRTRTLAAVTALVLGVAALASLGARAWWWQDDEKTTVPSGEARALGWEDLVPPDFVPPVDPTIDMTTAELDKLFDGSDESNRRLAEIDEALSYAPVNESLDGELVTLPGYVVPLEFDGQTRLEEFLLVPYFGACIHTPPPPANQIVMSRLEETTEIENTWEPVQLRGVLRTETSTTALAETGYTMDVIAIEPYEPAAAVGQ